VKAVTEQGFSCWRDRMPAEELPLTWDGSTIWCDGCDDGQRCGKSTVIGWPSGIHPVVDVRTGQVMMEVGGD